MSCVANWRRWKHSTIWYGARIVCAPRSYGNRSTGSARASRASASNLADLGVTAPYAGVLVLPQAADLPQRYLRQGELVGYVTEDGDATVRAVVTQDEVDLIRNRTERVDLRSTERFGEVIPARLAREVPSASLKLPSVALGTTGGGRIPIDPRDPNGEQALEKVFQFDLIAAGNRLPKHIGSRVYVRFDHGWEPIGWTWYRALRRLFLRHFDL